MPNENTRACAAWRAYQREHGVGVRDLAVGQYDHLSRQLRARAARGHASGPEVSRFRRGRRRARRVLARRGKARARRTGGSRETRLHSVEPKPTMLKRQPAIIERRHSCSAFCTSSIDGSSHRAGSVDQEDHFRGRRRRFHLSARTRPRWPLVRRPTAPARRAARRTTGGRHVEHEIAVERGLPLRQRYDASPSPPVATADWM